MIQGQRALAESFAGEDDHADLVIWDSELQETISVESHHQNCDLNIYEGIIIKGMPEFVIKGGDIVVNKELLLSDKIKSNCLKRKI